MGANAPVSRASVRRTGELPYGRAMRRPTHITRAASRNETHLVGIFDAAGYDCYIGRFDDRDPRDLRPGETGFPGNPFQGGTPEENLECFRKYFLGRLAEEPRFVRAARLEAAGEAQATGTAGVLLLRGNQSAEPGTDEDPLEASARSWAAPTTPAKGARQGGRGDHR